MRKKNSECRYLCIIEFYSDIDRHYNWFTLQQSGMNNTITMLTNKLKRSTLHGTQFTP